MKKAFFRFYEELNDFLPEARRKIKFKFEFGGRVSVKDMIESLGVPHTEIDLIIVNGSSVNFNYLVRDSDSISVYPEFESIDISSVQRLRPDPLREPKFILDVHLGKLARYMRMLGIDTLYENDYADEQIVKISKKSKRCILTRDIGILKRNEVVRAYWLRNIDPRKQIMEVIDRFDLQNEISEFTRCITCNGLLKQIEKGKIINKLPEMVNRYYSVFFVCGKCNKIYWEGTHHDEMIKLVNQIKHELRNAQKNS